MTVEPSKGWRTSEFKLSVATSLVGLGVLLFGVWKMDPLFSGVGAGLMAWVSGAYAKHRGGVKAAALDANGQITAAMASGRKRDL